MRYSKESAQCLLLKKFISIYKNIEGFVEAIDYDIDRV